MKYMDGQQVKVLIGGLYRGLVVADMDGDGYSADHLKEQWGYLQSGVMIDTDFGGLIHYKQNSLESEQIALVGRA